MRCWSAFPRCATLSRSFALACCESVAPFRSLLGSCAPTSAGDPVRCSGTDQGVHHVFREGSVGSHPCAGRCWKSSFLRSARRRCRGEALMDAPSFRGPRAHWRVRRRVRQLARRCSTPAVSCRPLCELRGRTGEGVQWNSCWTSRIAD
jgi:hypothetical protein